MSDNYSFYFGHVPFSSRIYSADEIDGIVDDLRSEFGTKASSVYRYRGTVPEYSDLPADGNEPGDVWNVEDGSNDAGMNYAWAVDPDDSNDQGHWDPLGPSLEGYATKEYVDEGLSGKMPANATGEDILATSSGPLTIAQAMEGNATAIGSIGTQAGNTAEALSTHVSDDVAHVTASDKSWWNGKASVEDVTLNVRGPNHDGFSEFKLVDAPAGVTMVSQPNYNNDDDDWTLTIEYNGDTFLGVTSGGFDGNELSITIDFDGISPSGPVGITATREALPGYVLGGDESDDLNHGKYLAGIEDATLVPVYSDTPTFSEWMFSDEGEHVISPVVDGAAGWYFRLDDYNLSEPAFNTKEEAETSLVLNFPSVGITATRTRTDMTGYQLGSQSDKTIAPAGDYALKSDIPAVVSPSTDAADAGKAVDAKAVGDALAERPTKAQMDAGWWSRWTITCNGVDVTSQVLQPSRFVSDVVGWNVPTEYPATSFGAVLYDGTTGYNDDTSLLEWTSGVGTWSSTRHRVAAPVPTKPDDIGAAGIDDIPPVVAPSTVAADAGKAADAKATGDALVFRPTMVSLGDGVWVFVSGIDGFLIISGEVTPLPAGKTSFDDGDYSNNTNLTFVYAPNVTTVWSAFDGCSSLASVYMPAITFVGPYAFEGCSSLASVSFPAATSIAVGAFHNCISLASVFLPVATSVGSESCIKSI